MISILLALKDNPTLTVLSYHLERCGFIINSVRSSDNLSLTIDRIDPVILIVDEDLPGNVSVLKICKELRDKYKTKNIHTILVANKIPQQMDQFINDYILKPFVPSSLVSKIKALAKESTPSSGKVLNYNDIEMHVDSFRVTRLGKVIHLGPTEFKILQCFLEWPGKVLSREHIMNHVWGYDSQVEPRTIDVHINRLRSALKDSDDELSLIRTIRSAGYSLNMIRSTVRV